MKKLMFAVAAAAFALVANAAYNTKYLTGDQDLADPNSSFAVFNETGDYIVGEDGTVTTNIVAFQYGNGKDADAKGPMTYSMSGDVRIKTAQAFILPGILRSLTFDLGGHTLYTGANNFNYTSTHQATLGEGRYCYYFKNGTIDCSGGSGYLKLMGRWNSSGGDRNLICGVDKVDIVSTASGMQGQWCVGGISNELTMVDSSFSVANSLFALFSGNTTTESLSVDNTFTLRNSSVKCVSFYTDYARMTPTKALDTNSRFVFDNSKLDTSSTMYIGTTLGGNTVTFENGSEIKCAGNGLLLGVNSSFSQNNSLVVKDSSVTVGSHIGIGHASGTRNNSAYFENSTISTPYFVIGDTHGNRDNSLYLKNCTLNLTEYYKFYFYSSFGTLTFDNQLVNDAGNTFKFACGMYAGHPGTDTNNTMRLINGSVFKAASFVVGTYSAADSDFMAQNNTLYIGSGSKLEMTGQFMNSGVDNEIILDNGTIDIVNNGSRYVFYIGHTSDATKHPNSGNKLILRGNNPKLRVASIAGANSNGKDAQINIQNDSKVIFELPDDGEYLEVPMKGDCINFSQAGAEVVIENLDTVVETIPCAKDIVLAEATPGSQTDPLGWIKTLDATSKAIAAAYPGCKITRQENNTKLVLHVEPAHPVATLTHNGVTVKYQDLEALNAAMVDGDKITMTDSVDSLVLSGEKSISAALVDGNNANRCRATSLTICDGITVSHGVLKFGDSGTNSLGLAYRTAQDMSITVKDATLNLSSQFMTSGTNNTVVLDNGAIYVDAQYAVYVGHTYPTARDCSKDNHFIVKGKAPRLAALHQDKNGIYDSDFSIANSYVEFYLPTDPADIYKEPVCESGNSCYIDGTCTVEFHNLAALQLNLSGAIDIPLIRTRKTGSKPGISRNFVTPLPTGCWISDVITDPVTGYSTLYLHVEPLGLSYSRPFTSFADYNAAMTGLGYDALYKGKDVYVVIRDFAFQKGVDYSPEKTNINREGATEPKLHAFFYNCTFPGGDEGKGGMMGGDDSKGNPAGSNRKQINLLGVKEAWVEGCTFEAFNGDSYVIDFNLSTKCENGGCGITITNNTFKTGAGKRVPLSVKNKADKDPAFVKIVDNYFAKSATIDGAAIQANAAGVLCFADQNGKGANFPITVENNRFEDGTETYVIMTGYYVGSGKEKIYVPVNKPFKWYYNERRGEWTAKPAFHQRVGTMIEIR